MRQLRRNELRSGQLRYLCCGGKGAPTQLQWKEDARHEVPLRYERYLVALQPPEMRDPSLEFQPYDDYDEDEADPEYSDDEEEQD